MAWPGPYYADTWNAAGMLDLAKNMPAQRRADQAADIQKQQAGLAKTQAEQEIDKNIMEMIKKYGTQRPTEYDPSTEPPPVAAAPGGGGTGAVDPSVLLMAAIRRMFAGPR